MVFINSFLSPASSGVTREKDQKSERKEQTLRVAGRDKGAARGGEWKPGVRDRFGTGAWMQGL